MQANNKQQYKYHLLPRSRKGWILFFWISICYLCTWLPHFGILNSLIWFGPITLPVLWIFGMNVLTTIAVIFIYKWYFKPFAERAEKEDIK